MKQLPKSVVREIRTLRSVGAGGGRLPPATRWWRGDSSPYADRDREIPRLWWILTTASETIPATGSPPHPFAELIKSVARRIVDRRVLHLIKMWLEAPVEEANVRGRKKRTTVNRDTRQGSPVSPLFSNIYMRRFVLGWKQTGLEQRLGARIVSYADNLVICCRRNNAPRALDAMRQMMGLLKLTANEDKTRICRIPAEEFDFLGYTFGRRYSTRNGQPYPRRLPKSKHRASHLLQYAQQALQERCVKFAAYLDPSAVGQFHAQSAVAPARRDNWHHFHGHQPALVRHRWFAPSPELPPILVQRRYAQPAFSTECLPPQSAALKLTNQFLSLGATPTPTHKLPRSRFTHIPRESLPPLQSQMACSDGYNRVAVSCGRNLQVAVTNREQRPPWTTVRDIPTLFSLEGKVLRTKFPAKSP